MFIHIFIRPLVFYQKVIMRFWAIVKDLPLWLLQVPRHSRWFRAPFHFILFQSITFHSGYPGLVLFVLSVDLRLIFSFEAVAMTIDLEAVGLWILKPIICIAELCLLILRPRRECQSLLWSRQRKRCQWDTA